MGTWRYETQHRSSNTIHGITLSTSYVTFGLFDDLPEAVTADRTVTTVA